MTKRTSEALANTLREFLSEGDSGLTYRAASERTGLPYSKIWKIANRDQEVTFAMALDLLYSLEKLDNDLFNPREWYLRFEKEQRDEFLGLPLTFTAESVSVNETSSEVDPVAAEAGEYVLVGETGAIAEILKSVFGFFSRGDNEKVVFAPHRGHRAIGLINITVDQTMTLPDPTGFDVVNATEQQVRAAIEGEWMAKVLDALETRLPRFLEENMAPGRQMIIGQDHNDRTRLLAGNIHRKKETRMELSELPQTEKYVKNVCTGNERNGIDAIAMCRFDKVNGTCELMFLTPIEWVHEHRRPKSKIKEADLEKKIGVLAEDVIRPENANKAIRSSLGKFPASLMQVSELNPRHGYAEIFVYINYHPDPDNPKRSAKNTAEVAERINESVGLAYLGDMGLTATLPRDEDE